VGSSPVAHSRRPWPAFVSCGVGVETVTWPGEPKRTQTEGNGGVMDQMFASWNRLTSWLGLVDRLRQAA